MVGGLKRTVDWGMNHGSVVLRGEIPPGGGGSSSSSSSSTPTTTTTTLLPLCMCVVHSFLCAPGTQGR